jgi:hypothetical protein
MAAALKKRTRLFDDQLRAAVAASGRASIPMEMLMRILAMTILTTATALTATAAQAQTYDPKYPVCLQVYQGREDFYFECAYTSLAQCNMSASGRAAQCVINPYYAKPGPRKKRSHR